MVFPIHCNPYNQNMLTQDKSEGVIFGQDSFKNQWKSSSDFGKKSLTGPRIILEAEYWGLCITMWLNIKNTVSYVLSYSAVVFVYVQTCSYIIYMNVYT